MYRAWIIIYLLFTTYAAWCQSLEWDLICKVMPGWWTVTPHLQHRQVTGLWATCCTAEKGFPNKTCYPTAQWERESLLLFLERKKVSCPTFFWRKWGILSTSPCNRNSGCAALAMIWSRLMTISLSLCVLLWSGCPEEKKKMVMQCAHTFYVGFHASVKWCFRT